MTVLAVIKQIELVNEANMVGERTAPEAVPLLAAKAAADGTSLQEAAAAVIAEFVVLKSHLAKGTL